MISISSIGRLLKSPKSGFLGYLIFYVTLVGLSRSYIKPLLVVAAVKICFMIADGDKRERWILTAGLVLTAVAFGFLYYFKVYDHILKL